MSKKTVQLSIFIFAWFLIGIYFIVLGIEPGLAKLLAGSESLFQTPLPQLTARPAAVVLGESTASASTPSGLTRAQVVKVIDGDTIEVSIEGSKKTIRYIGIDTPETVDPRRPVGCFGKEASNENKLLLEGKEVLLEKDVSETDKYSRLLRYIYLPQTNGLSLFVNDYLVREGFARSSSYPPDIKHQPRFLEAERLAREATKGLWGKCPQK